MVIWNKQSTILENGLCQRIKQPHLRLKISNRENQNADVVLA
ncbi:hypothetical protein BBFGKLBO_01101 [Synechococcus sp. CBW1107]|nr:hypothetical protein BBFGKLBO_01101 [Synechococcus sp. CBW1107]